MNICIDKEHDLKILRLFLEELKKEENLPNIFDIAMMTVETISIVMHWKLFEYGYCFFKQLMRTTMVKNVSLIVIFVSSKMFLKSMDDRFLMSKDKFLTLNIDQSYGRLGIL